MPYLYAHYLTGKKVLEQLPAQASNIILPFKNSFLIGCQGPDVFFYRYRPPAKFPLKALGNRLHDTQVHATMRILLEGALQKGRRAMSYFFGYLCHYALDCAAHPYIYYCSEEVVNHMRFETELDMTLLKYLGLNIHYMPPSSLIPLLRSNAQDIGNLFPAAGKILGFEVKEQDFYLAYKDMLLFHRASFDRSGNKAKFLEKIKSAFGVKRDLPKCIYKENFSSDIDYLNLNRKQWCTPLDNSIKSNATFFEMMDAAVTDTLKMIGSVINGSLEEALKIIGGRKFDTGLDWQDERPMCYFDCVYGTKK